jgi:hypothetical protein
MVSMAQLRILPFVLAVASIAILCASAEAQTETAQDLSEIQLKVKPVPDVLPPMPFPPGSETPGRVAPVEYRSADQMTQKDSDLVADAESSINEHAGRVGLEFNQGAWSYQQLVCPALPNHIFLRFMRNNGTGDMSVFTASIPRGGEGRVRIIPIQLRGYSLFSPAPINALTISAFNHIRGEENPDQAPDWLGTGLCYAALAGAHPQAANLVEDPESGKFPAAVPAELQIPVQGGAFISFTDVAATPRPMEWTMTFDGKGRLLKATHLPAGLLPVNAVPQSAGELKGNPLPPTILDVDLTGSPVPPAQSKTYPVPSN